MLFFASSSSTIATLRAQLAETKTLLRLVLFFAIFESPLSTNATYRIANAVKEKTETNRKEEACKDPKK